MVSDKTYTWVVVKEGEKTKISHKNNG